MSTHQKLDEAIRRGEIKRCHHCGVYWVPTQSTHRCVGMAEAERDAVLHDMAKALICAPDNEAILRSIHALQAGRAPVRVKLPPAPTSSMFASHESQAEDYGYERALEDCTAALKAQGVEVEG